VKQKLAYNESSPDEEDYLTVSAAAKLADIKYTRFRKALQRLEIKVRRFGWVVLVPRSSIRVVKKAIRDGKIKRGRPAKKRAVLVKRKDGPSKVEATPKE
jgi:hypothetical protein